MKANCLWSRCFNVGSIFNWRWPVYSCCLGCMGRWCDNENEYKLQNLVGQSEQCHMRPTSLAGFARHSNSKKISPCCKFSTGHQITTILCTCRNSTVVLAKPQLDRNHLVRIEVRAKRNSYRIWITMKNPSEKWISKNEIEIINSQRSYENMIPYQLTIPRNVYVVKKMTSHCRPRAVMMIFRLILILEKSGFWDLEYLSKSMLHIKDFKVFLNGCRLCCQSIECQKWKLSLTMNVKIDISLQPRPLYIQIPVGLICPFFFFNFFTSGLWVWFISAIKDNAIYMIDHRLVLTWITGRWLVCL